MSSTSKANLPKAQRTALMVVSIIAAMMAILDASAVNVSLPYIQGGLSGSPDTITWVIIVYMLGASLVTPISDAVSERYGAKRVFVLSIIVFGIASMLCGMANSLALLIIIRGVQGMAGGFLSTLAETLLLSLFSEKERRRGVSIYAICLMVGPVIGPILGGILTAKLSWPWVFYINLPFCLICLLILVRDLPKDQLKGVSIDFNGVWLIAGFVIALELIMSRGNHYDWWGSMQIVMLTAVCVVCGLIFVIRGWGRREHIIPFRIFHNRSFNFSAIALLLFGMPLIGTMVMLPLYLQMVFHYPADYIGYLLAPRSIAIAIAFVMLRFLEGRVNFNVMMLIGLVLTGYSSWRLAQLGMQFSDGYLLWLMVMQGFGIGFFMLPVMRTSIENVSLADFGLVSALTNFFRNMGGSVAVAFAVFVYASTSQKAWYSFGSHLHASNPYYQDYMRHLHALGLPLTQQYQVLSGTLTKQSSVIGFSAAFYAIANCCWLLILWISWRVISQAFGAYRQRKAAS